MDHGSICWDRNPQQFEDPLGSCLQCIFVGHPLVLEGPQDLSERVAHGAFCLARNCFTHFSERMRKPYRLSGCVGIRVFFQSKTANAPSCIAARPHRTLQSIVDGHQSDFARTLILLIGLGWLLLKKP